jgi:hypothetical protein
VSARATTVGAPTPGATGAVRAGTDGAESALDVRAALHALPQQHIGAGAPAGSLPAPPTSPPPSATEALIKSTRSGRRPPLSPTSTGSVPAPATTCGDSRDPPWFARRPVKSPSHLGVLAALRVLRRADQLLALPATTRTDSAVAVMSATRQRHAIPPPTSTGYHWPRPPAPAWHAPPPRSSTGGVPASPPPVPAPPGRRTRGDRRRRCARASTRPTPTAHRREPTRPTAPNPRYRPDRDVSHRTGGTAVNRPPLRRPTPRRTSSTGSAPASPPPAAGSPGPPGPPPAAPVPPRTSRPRAGRTPHTSRPGALRPALTHPPDARPADRHGPSRIGCTPVNPTTSTAPHSTATLAERLRSHPANTGGFARATRAAACRPGSGTGASALGPRPALSRPAAAHPAGRRPPSPIGSTPVNPTTSTAPHPTATLADRLRSRLVTARDGPTRPPGRPDTDGVASDLDALIPTRAPHRSHPGAGTTDRRPSNPRTSAPPCTVRAKPEARR